MASSSAAQRAESPSDSEYAEDISDSAPNKFKLSQRSFMRMIRQREAQLDAAATAEKYKSKRANKMGNIFSNKITSNTNSYKFTQFRIPVDGWRKKCLFLLMLVLFILIGINMALTLWIIKVMEFSSVRYNDIFHAATLPSRIFLYLVLCLSYWCWNKMFVTTHLFSSLVSSPWLILNRKSFESAYRIVCLVWTCLELI